MILNFHCWQPPRLPFTEAMEAQEPRCDYAFRGGASMILESHEAH
jgi:hypothetical protein